MSQSFLFRTALTTSTIWEICAAHFCSKEEIISQENTTGVFFHVQEERPASPQASLNCLSYLAFSNTIPSLSTYIGGGLNSIVFCWSPFSWINWPLLTASLHYKGILESWRNEGTWHPKHFLCAHCRFGSTRSGSFLSAVIVSEPHMQVLARGIIFGKWFLRKHSADLKEITCSRNFSKYFNHLKFMHRDDSFKQCL